MGKYAVALGEMFDGITFHGPFDEFEDAEAWADRQGHSTNWWVVQLEDPNNEDGE